MGSLLACPQALDAAECTAILVLRKDRIVPLATLRLFGDAIDRVAFRTRAADYAAGPL